MTVEGNENFRVAKEFASRDFERTRKACYNSQVPHALSDSAASIEASRLVTARSRQPRMACQLRTRCGKEVAR